MRTCVGCRQRTAATELLRVVAGERGVTRVAIPDPARRLPGRGAWLHPDPACLALAEKRRAFGRALRLTGVAGNIDTGPLRDRLAQFPAVSEVPGGPGTPPGPTDEK